jgi:hypothetical protein
MTSTVALFKRLTTEQKDQFCDDLVSLGLVSELNPKQWKRSVKQAVKKSKGTLKKLYQSFQHIDAAQRAKFYDSFFGVLDD